MKLEQESKQSLSQVIRKIFPFFSSLGSWVLPMQLLEMSVQFLLKKDNSILKCWALYPGIYEGFKGGLSLTLQSYFILPWVSVGSLLDYDLLHIRCNKCHPKQNS